MMMGTSQQIDSQFGTHLLRWETTRSRFAFHLHLSPSPPPAPALLHADQTCVFLREFLFVAKVGDHASKDVEKWLSSHGRFTQIWL